MERIVIFPVPVLYALYPVAVMPIVSNFPEGELSVAPAAAPLSQDCFPVFGTTETAKKR